MTPLDVCAITSGHSMPSARFRVRQHIEPLAQLDIAVTECTPRVPQAMPMPGPLARVRRRHLAPLAAAWSMAHALSRIPALWTGTRSDLAWVERTFVPGLEGLARLVRAPIVLDIDDAVWLEGLVGRAAPQLAQLAAAGIAGNVFLADWLSQHCRRVHVVPTAIDCERFSPGTPQSSAAPDRPVVFGWTGTSGNFPYLERIAPAVRAALDVLPGALLHVVADRRPPLSEVPASRIRFERWTPAREAAALRAMDVGLMPLDDTDWTRGKCSFKMLQYMATGLPTVVSPVGMNVEVLAHGESGVAAATPAAWTEALVSLARDAALRARLGRTGRAVVLAHYDVPVIAARLARVFRETAG